jgi:hypothetical protein
LAWVHGTSLLAAVLLTPAHMPRRLDRPSTRSEVFIGRSLAICAHPVAAWRTTVRSFRVVLVAGYFAVAYVAVFAALLLTQ